MTSEARDMQLQLQAEDGTALLPCTKGALVEISYDLTVHCFGGCAADTIVLTLPVNILPSAPPQHGLAALGMACPAGMTFSYK